MTIEPSSLDIVTVATELTAWIVGSEAAEFIGPYAVIILGAVGGATWSASSRGGATRWQTFRHVLWMVGLALIATVPLAALISRWTTIAPRWLLAPLAAAIAARPDWVVAQVRRLIESRTKGHGHDVH